MTLSLADILAARRTIRGIADATPFVPSPYLEGLTGQPFFLKLENMQPIGAFKLRGAVNAVANLPEGTAGVACCSTGNHGRALAYAARARAVRAVVCMSHLVHRAKVDAIRALGAEVRINPDGQDAAQEEVDRLCAEEGLVDVSPFDDPHVIAGQGTIGLEMLEAQPDLRTLVIPLSGGGLAGGIAVAAKAIRPDIRIVGVTMDRGPAMYESIRAGRVVQVVEYPSLADSLGGGIGLVNNHSLALCSRLIDEVVLVSEEEIYRAMQALFYEDRIVAEGACVVGIAALQAGKVTVANGPAATVITGRNVDMEIYRRVITGAEVRLGDYVIEGRPYAG